MLKINNVTAFSREELLLKNINLEILPNEIHAIVGPKHSNKSALAHSITGHPEINIANGDILLNSKSLINMPPEKRVKEGIFINFQTPPEFDEITNFEITKEIYGVADNWRKRYNKYCEIVGLDPSHADKICSLSEISISQSKLNEIVFMLMADPILIILDEIDKDLSDSQLIKIGQLLFKFLREKNRACLIISQNQTFLDIIKPTHFHIMKSGEIHTSVNAELVRGMIKNGYSEFS